MSGDQKTIGTPIDQFDLHKFDWEKLIRGRHKKFIGPLLSSTGRHVMLALFFYMRGQVENSDDLIAVDGYRCYPTTKTLAEDTGLSERAVGEHLTRARALGWITWREHGSGKKWRGRDYTPCMPSSMRQRADGE